MQCGTWRSLCLLLGLILPAQEPGEGWEAGAACVVLEITHSPWSSSVLGQMAPAAPKVTARPIWFYLWFLIKFLFLKVILYSAVSGAEAEIPTAIYLCLSRWK